MLQSDIDLCQNLLIYDFWGYLMTEVVNLVMNDKVSVPTDTNLTAHFAEVVSLLMSHIRYNQDCLDYQTCCDSTHINGNLNQNADECSLISQFKAWTNVGYFLWGYSWDPSWALLCWSFPRRTRGSLRCNLRTQLGTSALKGERSSLPDLTLRGVLLTNCQSWIVHN